VIAKGIHAAAEAMWPSLEALAHPPPAGGDAPHPMRDCLEVVCPRTRHTGYVQRHGCGAGGWPVGCTILMVALAGLAGSPEGT